MAKDMEKQAHLSSDDASTEVVQVHRGSVHEVMMANDLLDPKYEQTKRGLKSRHAQMIALGGTIGTGVSHSALFWQRTTF